MVKKSVYTLMMLMAFTASVAQVPDPPLFERHFYINNTDTLPYRLLKPESVKENKKYPLVIFLHGAGERGTNNFIQLRHIASLFLAPDNRSKYPCFVLAPQCPPKLWWANIIQGKLQPAPSKPMKLLLELLESMAEKYAIDVNRIYLTGLSMGGFGVWDALARHPDKFAAAAPICGGGDISIVSKMRHIPVWAFHGAKDNIVPVYHSRRMIEALEEANGHAKYTEYADVMHDSWTNAFKEPDFLPWLFSHRRTGRTAKLK